MIIVNNRTIAAFAPEGWLYLEQRGAEWGFH